jgi:hypothetical protein
MAEWKDVAEPVHSLTLTASTSCDHCALPIPINGPSNLLRCLSCKRETPIPHFFEVMSLAAIRCKALGEYQYAWFDDPSPECARCGKGVSIAPHLAKEGATTSLPCEGCGAPMATFPAPSWLKAHFPNALQVFGGDVEMANEQGGLDLHVNQAETKPIAMACPKCGGGLTIGSDTARTIPCQYCSTSVFIPEALWKELHPVKTMLRWTLTFTGELSTEKSRDIKSAQAMLESLKGEKESREKPAGALPLDRPMGGPSSGVAPVAPAGGSMPSGTRPTAGSGSGSKVALFVAIGAVVVAAVVGAVFALSGGTDPHGAPAQHPAKHGKH